MHRIGKKLNSHFTIYEKGELGSYMLPRATYEKIQPIETQQLIIQ